MPAYGTYMNETSYYEDGYGTVTERLVIASAYADLFMSKADYLASQDFVDLLEIGSSKEDVALESGSYSEDELSITMKQYSVYDTFSQNCYELVLQAQDTAYPLYVAWFIQPDDTTLSDLISTAAFIGVIKSDMKAKEITWRNHTEYDPDVQPLYEWDLKAKNFNLSSFDSDTMDALLDLLFADNTWKTGNISDRLGYCDLGGGKVTKFANLVNVNTINTKINSIMADRMTASIGSTFTIVVDECILDEKFSPARWVNSTDEYFSSGNFYMQGINRHISRNNIDFLIYENDAKTLKIGDGVSDDDSPWVSSQMYFWADVKLPPPNNATRTEAEDGSPQKSRINSFVEKSGITLAEYYIGLAASLGLIVRFYYVSATELHIGFSSREQFIKENCYIPDATESDITTNPAASSTKKTVYGVANNWCDEGSVDGVGNAYLHNNSYDPKSKGYNEEHTKRKEQTGDKIFLTISPTVRIQSWGDSQDVMPTSSFYTQIDINASNVKIPHNSAIYHPDGARRLDQNFPSAIWNSIGLHTAIYLKCTGNETTGYDAAYKVNYGLDGNTIWSPAAAGHYKYNGVDQTIYRQADYINALRGLDAKAYTTEKTLTIPYLCRFRKTQAGTDLDDDSGRGKWQNLSLGSKILFGPVGSEITYIVVGIERSSKDKSTRVRLWNSSVFAFSAASGLTSVAIGQTEPAGTLVQNNANHYVASGSIKAYDVIMMNSDGTCSKAISHSNYIGTFAGISLNDAADGEDVFVLRPGSTFYNPDFDYAPRTPLYLRYSLASPHNVSSSILSAKTNNENVSLLIGYATGGTVETTNFDNIDNQIILKQ